MPYSLDGAKIGTEKAAAALEKNRAVTLTATGFNYSTAGEALDGINEFTCVEGEAIRVGLDTIKLATAGAAIAKGAEVEVGTDGKLITLAAGVSVGRAYTAAAADGSEFSVKLK